MLLIAIDGACVRNGKPDCVSSGGIFVQALDENREVVSYKTQSVFERQSTNQRGEMLALLLALREASRCHEDAQIITDSEYLFNAVTKEWYAAWYRNNWIKSTGDPVKNADLWYAIMPYLDQTKMTGEISLYHIKGHCLSVGKVGARKLLEADTTGCKLYRDACTTFDIQRDTPKMQQNFIVATELSEKNNGFRLDSELLRRFITVNTVADVVATCAVADANIHNVGNEYLNYGSSSRS